MPIDFQLCSALSQIITHEIIIYSQIKSIIFYDLIIEIHSQ